MKRIIGVFLFLVLFIAGCSSGGNCAPNNSSPTAVQIGTLPNGSAVYLSNNNLPVTASTPTTATIYLVGGSANESYSVDFVSSKLQAKRIARVNQFAIESDGITVTPNPCMLGTAGSAYSSSCQVNIAVSSDTYPGTYNVTPTASSTSGTSTELAPITVLVSGSILPSTKTITSFSLNNNAGVITGNDIAVTVPYGTDVSALVATYITTGASVSVGSVTQTNGATVNNFTSPLTYTVHAENGSTRDYTVTVTVATNSAKAITAFALSGTSGIISDNAIAVTMPYGTTNVESLIATFTTTGESVTVESTVQVSAITQNNFTNPVVYTVHAADGSTQNYTVNVTVALNDAKELIQFSLDGTMGAINQVDGTIEVVLPSGTDRTALTASFISTGESVTVNDVLQTNEVTQNNFTNPVTYIVHAADGTTKDYIVTATLQPIITQATGITFSGESAFLTSNESSTITQCSVDESGILSNCVNLNLGNLLPNGALSISIAESSATSFATILANGATESAPPVVVSCPILSGTLNITDCISTNITPPTGLNASLRTTQKTNLTTTTLSSDLITSFSIKVKAGVVLAGVIDQTAHSIRVTVPYGVSLNGLVASFTVNGAKTTVKVNNVTQFSGVTANNFSSGLLYAVTPSGGSTVYYSVSVQNSNFAASALNTKNWTETIAFSYMPWFVTEQPFNPSAAYGYYKESAPFNMMGLSSIAYTTLNPTEQLPMYTVTNIESSLTYSCDMRGITNIDITKCASTNYINNPSSVAFMGAAAYSTIFYVASYSDNKLIPCASDGTSTTICGTASTSLPEISNAGLNYPRGLSYNPSKFILSAVNDGDNSYVSCKFGSDNGTTVATCTKHFFKDL